MKKAIQPAGTPAPIGPYSTAVRAGGMLFVSGQIPVDPQSGEMIRDDIRRATMMVMQNIEKILHEAGLNMAHVVKTTIFLADMEDFPAVNEAYAAFFEGIVPPARETVQAARLPKDAPLEISVIAVS